MLAALLLVTFGSRALTPLGFMPGPGGLVICTGQMQAGSSASAETISHDMSAMDMADMDMTGMDMPQDAGHPGQGGGSPEREGSSPCPFAAAATIIATSHVAVAIATVAAVARQIDLPPLPFVPRGTIVPTRLPRGPPSLT